MRMDVSERRARECAQLLGKTGMFAHCSQEHRLMLARRMIPRKLKRGTVLWNQGDTDTFMFVVRSGRVDKLHEIESQLHMADQCKRGDTIGTLYLLKSEASDATYKCVTDVTGFACEADDFVDEVFSNKEFSKEVVYSMAAEIKRQRLLLHTPLLSQHARPTPFFAVSIAASCESFYRSAMNALLNRAITGSAMAGALFPAMHVQVPARVLYINGFKGTRHLLEQHVDPDTYEYPEAVRLINAMIPGLVMNPISSILEACNAGNLNPEPLTSRWVRGFVPRGAREIIFGVGLNQLTDFFEERLWSGLLEDRFSMESKVLRNALSSVAAGVVCGYFSHVPHQLSSLKLNYPNKTYGQHWGAVVEQVKKELPRRWSPGVKSAAANAKSLLYPKGLRIRTLQIVGSFVILNGTVAMLQDWDPIPSIRMALWK